MRVLVVGAGVIGTVYGAHLGAAGHAVSVLSHPLRTGEIAALGLVARDVLNESRAEAGVRHYDLVLVAVRADQLAQGYARLTGLAGTPTVLFFGNNPGGRSALPPDRHGEIRLGFPGVGGVIHDEVAEYVRIEQQPTALQAGNDACVAEMDRTLRQRGFRVQRVTNMDGWLVRHRRHQAGRRSSDPEPHVLSRDRGVHRPARGRYYRLAAQPGHPARRPVSFASQLTPNGRKRRCGPSPTR
jgi:2-dehydropantoate 2-reductase